jgi:transposase
VLLDVIGDYKDKVGLPEDCRVVSCYEAGRDGFWIHRWLQSVGIDNIVVDSASLEVDRRAKHKKTDRIDAQKLLNMLMRHERGEEKKVWSVVNVPSEEVEDGRRLHRGAENLKIETTMHINQIRSLLITQGIHIKGHFTLTYKQLDDNRRWNGKPLEPNLKTEIKMIMERLDLAQDQLDSLRREQERRVKEERGPTMDMIRILMCVSDVGLITAWILVWEIFGWRQIRNNKQCGALGGLASVPYGSGKMNHDLGISRTGNPLVRSIMVELAWRWIKRQPGSALTQWYMKRFGGGGKGVRKKGAVALARKLLVALRMLVDYGIVPEGAIVRGQLAA